MKRVTASEARQNWFQLLDEVARGERVLIERRGRRIIVQCEDLEERTTPAPAPDYSDVLQAPRAEDADRWSWRWSEEEVQLIDESES